MNKEHKTAIAEADILLVKILETQPELLKPSVFNEDAGKKVGEFISALRCQLTTMYQKTQN